MAGLLFFSIESKDDRESAFSLDTFSDRTFARRTAPSFVLLVLSTALGIFHTVMKTATLRRPAVADLRRRGRIDRGGRRDLKAVLRRTAASAGMQVSR